MKTKLLKKIRKRFFLYYNQGFDMWVLIDYKKEQVNKYMFKPKAVENMLYRILGSAAVHAYDNKKALRKAKAEFRMEAKKIEHLF